MRKNKMMRLSALLLVAVLLSLSVISGTWAKYVTTSSQLSDTVTVAKWGVEVSVTKSGDKTLATGEKVVGEVLKYSAETKTIAPGFQTKIFESNITGRPEVATKVTYNATLNLTGWTLDDDSEYCPLVFTVDGKKYYIGEENTENDDVECEDVSKLKEEVVKAINAATEEYAADIDLSTGRTKKAEVYVSWAFDVNEGANDAKDTYLANKDVLPKIALTVTCTVTQITSLS